MNSPFSLHSKTILIVGASSGIGQATAEGCARMGARVILAARREKELADIHAQLEGSGHEYIVTDITNSDSVKKLVNTTPVIDGIVLSAGKGLTLPIPFCSQDKFEDIFQVNFFAQCELIRALYKKKKIAKDGSIVLISSIGGNSVYSPGASIYGASKAALSTFMRYCAIEFASRKIRVNTINPGMVKTKLIDRGTLSTEDFEKDIQRYPLKRYGEPADIANGAIYLLSDAASWVTGHSLVIDGGVSIV